MHSLYEEKDVIRVFFENYPRHVVVKKVVSSVDGLEEEEFSHAVLRLLYHMYLSPFARACPPAPRYRLRVLKDIIKELESSGREVPEAAYREHAALSAAPDADSTAGYVVYELSGAATVPLWEDRCLMAEGTTGLRTWQAGKALLDWYMLRPDALAGRRVLELGAGMGLTGLALCQLCRPKSYVITDGHPLVVQRLKHNVQKCLDLLDAGLSMVDEAGFVAAAPDLASPQQQQQQQRAAGAGPSDASAPGGDLAVTLGETRLTAAALDWLTFSEQDARRTDADLVLMADVSYNPELHEPLVRTVRLLLQFVSPPPEALLALTDRNETTTALLMKEIAQGLAVRLLATPPNNQSCFLMDEVSKVKMFEVTLAAGPPPTPA